MQFIFSILFSRPYWVVRSHLWYDIMSVCRLSVTFCIVAKRYVVDNAYFINYFGNYPNGDFT